MEKLSLIQFIRHAVVPGAITLQVESLERRLFQYSVQIANDSGHLKISGSNGKASGGPKLMIGA